MPTTVVLKGGKKVVHDADLYHVERDGSLALLKKQKQISWTPPKRSWLGGYVPIFPPPPIFPNMLIRLTHTVAKTY